MIFYFYVILDVLTLIREFTAEIVPCLMRNTVFFSVLNRPSRNWLRQSRSDISGAETRVSLQVFASKKVNARSGRSETRDSRGMQFPRGKFVISSCTRVRRRNWTRLRASGASAAVSIRSRRLSACRYIGQRDIQDSTGPSQERNPSRC